MVNKIDEDLNILEEELKEFIREQTLKECEPTSFLKGILEKYTFDN